MTLNPFVCSSAEWQARVDLAALYRLFDQYGWTDLTYTHISARVPGQPNHYLMNSYGLLFEEITASSLIKVDFEGKVVEGPRPYNKTGHLMHTAVMRARPEINYVLHSHTCAGVAVSAMRCGLLPLCEHANVVLGTLTYHRYGAIKEDNFEECEHLVKDLGNAYLMVLHNHGLLACGRTAGEAFLYHYFLEMACKVQVAVLQSGQEWVAPSDKAVAELSLWGKGRCEAWGAKQWAALVRQLERRNPAFKS